MATPLPTKLQEASAGATVFIGIMFASMFVVSCCILGGLLVIRLRRNGSDFVEKCLCTKWGWVLPCKCSAKDRNKGNQTWKDPEKGSGSPNTEEGAAEGAPPVSASCVPKVLPKVILADVRPTRRPTRSEEGLMDDRCIEAPDPAHGSLKPNPMIELELARELTDESGEAPDSVHGPLQPPFMTDLELEVKVPPRTQRAPLEPTDWMVPQDFMIDDEPESFKAPQFFQAATQATGQTQSRKVRILAL